MTFKHQNARIGSIVIPSPVLFGAIRSAADSTARAGRYLVLILILVAAGVSRLDARQTEPIDRPEELRVLNHYFGLAVEQNPELESLRYDLEALQQRAVEARVLPDPQFSAGFFLNPPREAGFTDRFSAQIMQSFPWFGTLDARGRVEEALRMEQFHSMNARQLEILREIQELWFTYFKLNHHVHVNIEILVILLELETQVEARYEGGMAGQADLLRIQMEEQRILNTIERLTDEKNPVREQFNALLNRDPSVEIATPQSLPPRTLAWSREELLELVRASHPDFDRIEAMRSRSKTEMQLARLEGLPDFGFGLEYMGPNYGMSNMMPEMNEAFIGIATIRIPLYRSRYRARRQEARLQINAADAMERDLINRQRVRIEESMASLRDGQREHRLITEELIPRTEQVMELLMEDYRSGRARFDELLQVVRELLALENEKVEALAKQNEAMADIETLIANDLHRQP